MKFDRTSESDEVVKDLAKKQASKVAKKASKKAGKAAGKAAAKTGKMAALLAKKTVLWIVGAIGAPAFIIIIIVLALLTLLPSAISSSTMGVDNAFPDGTLPNTVGSAWEDDATAALNERKSQLTTITFWDDLGSFFSTGSWGTSGKTFKTEYANADDLDKNGDSVSKGYFSSSNRMIAVVNEAFRSSLRDSNVLRHAKKAAKSVETEYIEDAKKAHPKPANCKNYTVNFVVEKDPDFADKNFIYESCYLLSAASTRVNRDDAYDKSVRNILDYAFKVTGIDPSTTIDEITWKPEVTQHIGVPDVITYTEKTGEFDYFDDVDCKGNRISKEEYEKLKKKGKPCSFREREREVCDVSITVKATYSLQMKNNYKDLVDKACGIELTTPPGTPSYEAPEKDQVEVAAMEIMKFYLVSADFGDFDGPVGDFAGGPLPPKSYHITSLFGPRILKGQPDFHNGVDMATRGEGNDHPPIFAVQDGIAHVPGYNDNGYGHYVYITHPNGLKTYYGHMVSIPVVNDGQEVKAGDILGYVGTSGNSTGNHLHFEIRDMHNNRLDPMLSSAGPYISEGATYIAG